MKKFQTLVLGLASVAMLASCAKDVTKEEATKIAQDNYGKVTYASGKETLHIKAEAKDENANAVKTLVINGLKAMGIEDGKTSDITNTSVYTVDAEYIAALSADAKFQADGNKLAVTYTEKQYESLNLKGTSSLSCDENGYFLSMKTSLSYEGDKVKVEIGTTYTWTR